MGLKAGNIQIGEPQKKQPGVSPNIHLSKKRARNYFIIS